MGSRDVSLSLLLKMEMLSVSNETNKPWESNRETKTMLAYLIENNGRSRLERRIKR